MSFFRALKVKGVKVNKWRKRHGLTAKNVQRSHRAYKKYKKSPSKYTPW